MRCAHIVPIPELDRLEDRLGTTHLVLAHLLEDERYRTFYASRRKRGHFLILDNSAHENGSGEAIDELLRKAAQINAQEVVLPDVLFDALRTIARAREAAKHLASLEANSYRPESIMIVPQADTRREWTTCLRALHETVRPLDMRIVVGISKDYENWIGGLYSLIADVYTFFHVEQNEVTIHLLGWGRALRELHALARVFKKLRSIDSAKPSAYALDWIRLPPSLTNVATYPGRGHGFFSQSFDDTTRRIALHNINVFEQAAAGRAPTS